MTCADVELRNTYALQGLVSIKFVSVPKVHEGTKRNKLSIKTPLCTNF